MYTPFFSLYLLGIRGYQMYEMLSEASYLVLYYKFIVVYLDKPR